LENNQLRVLWLPGKRRLIDFYNQITPAFVWEKTDVDQKSPA
jgi:hypothetical protein